MSDYCTDLGTVVPNAKISRITLEASGIPASEDNPHIQGEERLRSQSSNTLSIKIQVVLKEMLMNNVIASWVQNEDFTKYLTVKVIQSTEPLLSNSTKFKLDDNDFWAMVNTNLSRPNFKMKVLNVGNELDNTSNQSLFESARVTTDSQGNDTYEFTFELHFEHPTTAPEHLTYFVRSELDLESILSNVPGLDLDDVEIDIGDPAVMYEVIKNGNIVDSENIIHDYRDFDLIINQHAGLLDIVGDTNLLSFVPESEEKAERKIALFSNLITTRDKEGNSRFFFGFDFKKALIENSVYSSMLQRLGPEQLRVVLQSSYIRSMKITRRRVQRLPSYNKLATPYEGNIIYDVNEAPVIVASGFELSHKTFQGRDLDVNDDTQNASIQEVEIHLENGNDLIRHFTAIDTSMSSITDGHYQYGVEVEIIDNTRSLFEDRIDNLMQLYEELSAYYQESTIAYDSKNNRGNYDITTNFFTQDYINSRQNRSPKPWIDGVAAYIDNIDIVMDMLDIKPTFDSNTLATTLSKLVHPSSGTPDGISIFMKLVKNLIDKIATFVQISVTSTSIPLASNKTAVASSTLSRSEIKDLSIKVDKYFANVFDSNVDKLTGYDYLGRMDGLPGSSAGLMIVSGVEWSLLAQEEKEQDEAAPNFFTDIRVYDPSTALFFQPDTPDPAPDFVTNLRVKSVNVGGNTFELDKTVRWDATQLTVVRDSVLVSSQGSEGESKAPTWQTHQPGFSLPEFTIMANKNCTIDIGFVDVFGNLKPASCVDATGLLEAADFLPTSSVINANLIPHLYGLAGKSLTQPGAGASPRIPDIKLKTSPGKFNWGKPSSQTAPGPDTSTSLISAVASAASPLFSQLAGSAAEQTNTPRTVTVVTPGPQRPAGPTSQTAPPPETYSGPGTGRTSQTAPGPSGRGRPELQITSILEDPDALADSTSPTPDIVVTPESPTTTYDVVYQFNHELMKEVEVLAGYNNPFRAPAAATSIPAARANSAFNSPIYAGYQVQHHEWQPLTYSRFNNAVKGMLLCRITSPSDVATHATGLELPVYHEYFILAPQNTVISPQLEAVFSRASDLRNQLGALWRSQQNRAQQSQSGHTTVDKGHTHTYEVDHNGNGWTSYAYHPHTAQIKHRHQIINGEIQEAKSGCYPSCKQKYGHEGVGPHSHNTTTADTSTSSTTQDQASATSETSGEYN